MRRLIKIIVIVILLIAAIGLYFYFSNSKTSTPLGNEISGPGINFRAFLPFSQKTNTQTNETPTKTDGTEPTDNTPGETDTESALALRRISDFSVAGATYFKKEKTVEIPPTEGSLTPTGTLPPPTTKKVVVPAVLYVQSITGHIFEKELTDE